MLLQLAQLLQQQYQQHSARVEAPQSVVSHGLNAASFPGYAARRFTGTSVSKDEVISDGHCNEFEHFAVVFGISRTAVIVLESLEPIMLTSFRCSVTFCSNVRSDFTRSCVQGK